MTAKIDIEDLTHPVLTPLQKEALAAAEANPVVLEEAVVLEAARKSTGLTDFGDEDFVPRLRLWLSEANAYEEITPYGRSLIFNVALTYASNRLRIEDWSCPYQTGQAAG